MIVTLTSAEEAHAMAVGRMRDASCRARGYTAGAGRGQVIPTAIADPLGAVCEQVVGLAYGWPWDDSDRPFERLHEPDVGPADVRGTTHERGHLLLSDTDAEYPDRPHVLVVSRGGGVYRIAGWCFNHYGTQRRWWSTRFRVPCYAVPQTALRAPTELVAALATMDAG